MFFVTKSTLGCNPISPHQYPQACTAACSCLQSHKSPTILLTQLHGSSLHQKSQYTESFNTMYTEIIQWSVHRDIGVILGGPPGAQPPPSPPPPPPTFPHYIATNATLLFCNPILLSTKCIKGTDPKFVLPECTRIDF